MSLSLVVFASTSQIWSLHSYKSTENVLTTTFFSVTSIFPCLQKLQRDADQVSNKTSLPSDLEEIAANKGFVVTDNQASGNCLFYALSGQLQIVKGIKISHKELRNSLVQFLAENAKLVSP